MAEQIFELADDEQQPKYIAGIDPYTKDDKGKSSVFFVDEQGVWQTGFPGKGVAEKWKDKIDPKVYQAMMNYEVKITD